MDAFSMCGPCHEDYVAPRSRRFHAQATARSACGPELRWLLPNGQVQGQGEEALRNARDVLLGGGIVAVMGIGGFHLAVNALDEAAVRRLRGRKQRPAKPLAVMMAEGEVARHCLAGDVEWQELRSRARPIVLLVRRADSTLAASIAPGMARFGVFLPYTGIMSLCSRIRACAASS